jgi:hypothetical protein
MGDHNQRRDASVAARRERGGEVMRKRQGTVGGRRRGREDEREVDSG